MFQSPPLWSLATALALMLGVSGQELAFTDPDSTAQMVGSFGNGSQGSGINSENKSGTATENVAVDRVDPIPKATKPGLVETAKGSQGQSKGQASVELENGDTQTNGTGINGPENPYGTPTEPLRTAINRPEKSSEESTVSGRITWNQQQDVQAKPERVIELETALSRTLTLHPDLAALGYERRAREAALRQSSAWIQPELEFELENVGGDQPFAGTDSAELTVLFSQTLELGGKRGRRFQQASLDLESVDWTQRSKRLDLLHNTAKAFVTLLIAQERERLQGELYRLAGEVLDVVAARVEAGKVSPLEETKVQVNLATAELEWQAAQRGRRGAKVELIRYWNQTEPDFDRVAGSLDILRALPNLADLEEKLGQNPDLARWGTALEKGRVSLNSAKAKVIPDVTFKAGWRKFREVNGQAYVVGASVPLPLFQRARAGRQKASARLDRIRQESLAARLSLSTELRLIYERLQTARAKVISGRERVLPAAQRVYEGMNEGYREGKFGLLDVLDAQRTLFEVRRHQLINLEEYRLLDLQLKRLTGSSALPEDSVAEGGHHGR